MRKLIIPAALLVVAAAVWVLVGRSRSQQSEYRFVEVTRGRVSSVVSSTGALQATTTVEVGTQVSGRIEEIYVDFNDRVTAGQLVARIDPTILQQEVRAAEATVERNQAEVDQARRELDRMERLFASKVVTDSEFTTAQYKLAVAQASLKSAQVQLERAQRNLDYTVIRAPISGVVLERAVDVGQTVAASFSAPLLFLIAEDLSAMEILAAVDESDIGNIHEGQPVRFTVQAYPDETFDGSVRQVRLQSTSEENVVNYITVISVVNDSGRLLPGMTATVDFVVEEATDVLRVANAALRLRPTAEMLAALRERRSSREGASGHPRQEVPAEQAEPPGQELRDEQSERPGEEGTVASRSGSPAPAGTMTSAAGEASRDVAHGTDEAGQSRALLWFLDSEGRLDAAPVVTGVSDDQFTEIRSPHITEGQRVIAAIASGSTSSSATNPFQGERRGFRGPPPVM